MGEDDADEIHQRLPIAPKVLGDSRTKRAWMIRQSSIRAACLLPVLFQQCAVQQQPRLGKNHSLPTLGALFRFPATGAPFLEICFVDGFSCFSAKNFTIVTSFLELSTN
jgi:hypothetical protein